MPAEAVATAKSFWESRLQEPVVDPRGIEVIVTMDDLYHLIVDPRIWRRPERIEKILTSVVEVVESKIPGFEILISEWEEDGKKTYTYAVLSLDKTVKTAHVVDEKKIRQLKRGAKVLWSK